MSTKNFDSLIFHEIQQPQGSKFGDLEHGKAPSSSNLNTRAHCNLGINSQDLKLVAP